MNDIITSGTLLVFDASGLTCSAAVIKNGRTVSSCYSNNGLTHSRTLLPAIERVISESQTDLNGIDIIALTVGPGSFTGVKIGVSTAKGLAFANKTPCLAVSSMAALACGAGGFEGIICPVSDARRGMFYNALFLCENGKTVRLCEDRQISADDLIAEISQHSDNTLIIGDGADLFEKSCSDKGLIVCRAPENVSFIHGEGIFEALKCGLYREETAGGLTAVYLRPPQAERERLEKLKNSIKE